MLTAHSTSPSPASRQAIAPQLVWENRREPLSVNASFKLETQRHFVTDHALTVGGDSHRPVPGANSLTSAPWAAMR